MECSQNLVGRNYEINRLLEALEKGLSFLITGEPGMGKSSVLRCAYEELSKTHTCIWVPHTRTKEQLVELAWQLFEKVGLPKDHGLIPEKYRHRALTEGQQWRWMERTFTRMRVSECVTLIERAITESNQPIVLFVESLDIPPTQAEYLLEIFNHVTVAAAMTTTNRRIRVQKLLWKFQPSNRLELKPLSGDAARTIIRRWLDEHPLKFQRPVTIEKFERRVVIDGAGVPAAIIGILEAATAHRVITSKTLDDLTHEAAVHGIDLTPVLILLVALAVASKFVGRGISSTELYVVAGIGIALGIVVRYILFPLLADPKKR